MGKMGVASTSPSKNGSDIHVRHWLVVSLLAADNCDRPLQSRLPGVNQTVIASQLAFQEPGPPASSAHGHTYPFLSHAHHAGHLLIAPAAVATAARGRATLRAASTPDRSTPLPWPVYRGATAWLSPCPWSTRAVAAPGGDWREASKSCVR
jgi:hypothetical protein